MPRPQRDFRLASDLTYKAYKEAYPNSQIDKKTFLKIIRRYNESIIEYCIDTGRMAILPRGFGQIFVKKKKQGNYFLDERGNKKVALAVDWKLSKEYGKKIYLQNFHTEGYRFRFIWRVGSRLTLGKYWRLQMARTASRLLAKRIKEDPQRSLNVYHEW